jgi:hypothetical protein
VTAVADRRRVRHVVRSWAAEKPTLYLPFARKRYPGPSPEVIGPETEVVIDGYTRCASTFAVYAFQLAQERPVRMAHHLHAPAQLIAAAKAHLPTIVVIRDPEGAILSQAVREPGIALRDALWAYERFYARLLPYRSSYVVADSKEVTTDFASVVRRLNARFGTSFREFDPTEENVARCLALMRERSKLPEALLRFESGTASLDEALSAAARAGSDREESGAWVPSPEREQRKDALRADWLHPRLERSRARARATYESFLRDDVEAVS